MWQEIETLLLKSPQHRLKNEVDQLVNLTATLPFFKEQLKAENGQYVHRQCCKHMLLESYLINDIVFEIDSIGTKFYIILQGIVKVLVRKQDIYSNEMEVVKRLRKGDSFGEFALINKQPRLATIQCVTDCQFAVLNKLQFKQILMCEQQKKIDLNVEYFAQVYLFQGQHKINLRKLYLNSFAYEFEKHQLVLTQGDVPEFCYLIQEGEFLLQKQEKNRIFKICEIGGFELVGLYQMMNKLAFNFSIICNTTKGQIIKFNNNAILTKIYQENFAEILNQFNCFNAFVEQKIRKDEDYILKFKQYIENHPKPRNDPQFGTQSDIHMEKQPLSARHKKLNSPRFENLKAKLDQQVSQCTNLTHRNLIKKPIQLNTSPGILYLFLNKNKQYERNKTLHGPIQFKYRKSKESYENLISINSTPQLLSVEKQKDLRSLTQQSSSVTTARTMKRTSTEQNSSHRSKAQTFQFKRLSQNLTPKPYHLYNFF